MNFDEINKAMEEESQELVIPLSVTEIKSSHSSLKKLKKWIYSELFALVVIVLLLIFLYFKVGDHLMAQTLYKYTAFISVFATLGFIALQIRLLNRLNIDNSNSRRVIEGLLIQIKSYYEVSKYIMTGLAASIFIPIKIANISKNRSDQYITDYLSLNLDTSQVLYQVGWILFLSFLVYVGGYLLFKQGPDKEIKKLERTLDHF